MAKTRRPSRTKQKNVTEQGPLSAILKISSIVLLLGFITICLLWDNTQTVNTKDLNINKLPYSKAIKNQKSLPKEFNSLADLIKKQEKTSWFMQANKRVEEHRKADLVLVLKDSRGNSIPHKDVKINLESHDFHHGGIMSIWQFSGTRKSTKPYIDPKIYRTKFLELFNKRKGNIKRWLLEQTVIAGIGNIYADEALFYAGIRPSTNIENIDEDSLKLLFESILKALKQGIRNRGTSISDFRDAYGSTGRNQEKLYVYGRAGQECLKCSNLLIRIKVAGRGTVYCEQCQQ